MNSILIITLPLYFFYILFLLIYTFKHRVRALRAGQIDLLYLKSGLGQAPSELKNIENHFNNQFQIPILYFIACLAFIQFNFVSTLTLILAYTFLISRVFHSIVHLGRNSLKKRPWIYLIGVLCVLFMWIEFLIQLGLK